MTDQQIRPEPRPISRGRNAAPLRPCRGSGPRLGGLILTAWFVAAAPALADYPDWDSLSDVAIIEVVTADEDGDLRVKKVWFVLVDGVPYLRTNRSRWLDNLRRDPNLGLRIESHEYQATAEEIPGDEIVEIVDRASAEKYGWQESLIHPFRIFKPDILKLGPRPETD
jgi:hypothetical protein